MHTQPNVHMPQTPTAKNYRAQMQQSGTDAPTATILNNTIGNIIWTRVSQGYYKGTLSGAFPTDNQCWLTTSQSQGPLITQNLYRQNANEIDLNTYDSTGSVTDDWYSLYIDIWVYEKTL